MKNLKKVLALAVAFVMCFTMFAGAAVYSDVPAGSDYSEAVSLLSDLGVIAGLPDGSFGVDKTITRADAACLIARMLTGETMPSKYAGASNFVDVPKSAYYESAVAYCAIMGITSGTSTTAGTYSPSREITDGEFIAMITRALGYDSAANPLQFPMGNVARAQQEGILDGVNVEVNSPALRGEDAQMIYNALFADYDAYAKQQNIYQSADDQVEYTIAHEVFSLDRLAVNTKDEVKYKDQIDDADEKCVAHQWVVVGVDPRDAANTYTAFPILDKDKTLDPDWTNATDKDYAEHAITFVYEGDAESILGYEVELWGDDDHTGTEHDIVAVKTVKGQTAYDWNISMGEDGSDDLTVASDKTVDAEDAMIAVGNTIDEDSGDLFEGVHIDDSKDVDAYLLYNFDPASSEADDKWQEDEWKNKDGDSFRLFDWDSDGDIDFVLRTVRKYGEVTDIDSQDISFKSIENGKEINIAREIDDNQLKFNCEGIEEDDVIEMTYSRAYDKSEDGEVVTVDVKKVSSDIKQLTKVSTKGELEMTFDGDVYKYADDDYAWDYVEDEENNLVEDDLEGNYEIWLDANGYIVKLVESDSNTGYLVALELDDGEKVLTKSRSTRAAMKAKLDDNTVDVFDVAYDLQITGTVAVKDGDADTAANRKDIQTIVYPDIIDKDSIRTKENINKNGDLYDKSTYSWPSENRIVGQVFKYWMDSDKIITKLERVAETVDYYDRYYDNTGVVQVAGGGAENDYTYQGRSFNGNVYLKNAKVLFVTGYGFVGTEDNYWGGSHVAADEDLVLAIEPTTANLRAIDIATGNASNLAKQGDANANAWGGATWYNENKAVYAGQSVVGEEHNNGKTAQIAYDIDNNNYASAAIMTIDNFDNFDKKVTVGLITDVSAQNRKNTVFTIDGAIAGQVGSFTTVEADDGAEEIFYRWTEVTKAGDAVRSWDAVAYDDLSAVRDDIDDNAVYAEITQDPDGKITKVIVMDYMQDYYGALVGEKKMVVRLVVGNKAEVDGSSVAFASHAANTADSGKNIMVYADKENLYEMSNISWHNSFDLTGSTQHYMITNKVKDVIGMEGGQMLQAQYGSGGTPNAGFTDEPKIKTSDAASITTSRTRETSNADKYAVADVAFNKISMAKDGRFFNALNGADALAVFSYEKRFGMKDADEVLPTVSIESSTDGVAATNGQAQQTEIWLTGAASAGSDVALKITAGKLSYNTTVSAGQAAPVVAAELVEKLGEAWKDDFTVELGSSNEIVLTAKEATDHKSVKVNGLTTGQVVAGITATVTDIDKGVPKTDKAVPASITLKFTGAANVDVTEHGIWDFGIEVTYGDPSVTTTWSLPKAVDPNDATKYVPMLSSNGSAADVASWLMPYIEAAVGAKWDVEDNKDGTVTITQKTAGDEAPIIWADKIVDADLFEDLDV